MITVSLRVLGIYFGSYPGDPNSVTGEVQVMVQEKPTVFDIMREVVRKADANAIPGVKFFGFTPLYPQGDEEINSITVEFTIPPRKDRPYVEGTYVLEDSKSTNPNRVLQYYIVDSTGVQKNRNNRTKPFAATPDVDIVDGDTVIWRQVSICVGPNGGFRARSVAERGLRSLRK
jgi:hypothetical protein